MIIIMIIITIIKTVIFNNCLTPYHIMAVGWSGTWRAGTADLRPK